MRDTATAFSWSSSYVSCTGVGFNVRPLRRHCAQERDFIRSRLAKETAAAVTCTLMKCVTDDPEYAAFVAVRCPDGALAVDEEQDKDKGHLIGFIIASTRALKENDVVSIEWVSVLFSFSHMHVGRLLVAHVEEAAVLCDAVAVEVGIVYCTRLFLHGGYRNARAGTAFKGKVVRKSLLPPSSSAAPASLDSDEGMSGSVQGVSSSSETNHQSNDDPFLKKAASFMRRFLPQSRGRSASTSSSPFTSSTSSTSSPSPTTSGGGSSARSSTECRGALRSVTEKIGGSEKADLPLEEVISSSSALSQRTQRLKEDEMVLKTLLPSASSFGVSSFLRTEAKNSNKGSRANTTAAASRKRKRRNTEKGDAVSTPAPSSTAAPASSTGRTYVPYTIPNTPSVIRSNEVFVRMAVPEDKRNWCWLVLAACKYDMGGSDMLNLTLEAACRMVVLRRSDNALVGLLSLQGNGWVSFIACDVEYRNAGLGSYLLFLGMEWLRVRSVPTISLTPLNRRVISFYRKWGFEEGTSAECASKRALSPSDIVMSRKIAPDVLLLNNGKPLSFYVQGYDDSDENKPKNRWVYYFYD